ncbi:hypothetical protein [Flavobacterium kingsejongi]|uniref:Uncharacterized protein n=1 Tax=Flavobacterium kingsejongi TaxID=1678728 RepID=A0A2S1LM89_9FLAO|nr:hypothetical protein [Flavobacterium kingsejongi]AWG24801.1 hypothetical protein FK004_05950 [Flavobacterium kingsejongi]AWG25053.1 hypothetical protein FK004_07305 [Flavobacterium kingsejongi]
MSKETQKNNNYNTEILNALAFKYSVTVNYIRKCLRGSRKGKKPEIIILEYEEGVKQYQKGMQPIISKFINEN